MKLFPTMNMKTTQIGTALSLGYFLLCFKYVKQITVEGKIKKGRNEKMFCKGDLNICHKSKERIKMD